MIRYSTGEPAEPGDCVTYFGEDSIVESVVEGEEALRHWGVDRNGLMLRNASFGHVFIPIGSDLDHDVAFKGRAP